MTCNQKWRNSSTDTRATYASWYDMRTRCHDPEDRQFHLYGGRGIFVCDRWRDDYDAFYEDMGPRPIGMSIERVDNDQGYDPFNCVWAPKTAQQRNTRRNHVLTIAGETKNLVDWAKQIGIDPKTLYHRIQRGYSKAQLLAPPRREQQRFKKAA